MLQQQATNIGKADNNKTLNLSNENELDPELTVLRAMNMTVLLKRTMIEKRVKKDHKNQDNTNVVNLLNEHPVFIVQNDN